MRQTGGWSRSGEKRPWRRAVTNQATGATDDDVGRDQTDTTDSEIAVAREADGSPGLHQRTSTEAYWRYC